MFVQTDAEIGPVETDLLSENDNKPAVRRFTMKELQQMDEVYEDECELAFESVNDLFPALERNGTEIRTTWTGISMHMTKPQTSLPRMQPHCILPIIQPHSKYKKNIWALSSGVSQHHHPVRIE